MVFTLQASEANSLAFPEANHLNIYSISYNDIYFIIVINLITF